MDAPLLSVCLITFNHERFIKQAIDSVLMQKVNFSWELIIADDFSTDGTREILLDYKKRYPEFIKLVLQRKNVGPAQNWIDLLTTPSSKYIAYFEGDDYWTNPNKLQLQVDFLEENVDFGLVHHESDYLFQNSGVIIKNHHKTNNVIVTDGFVYEELLKANNIYSPTVMFRTCLIKHFLAIDENIRREFLMGDYVMWLEFSQHCKFYYFSQSMAVYRVLDNSASKSTSYEKALLFLNSYFDIQLFFLKRFPVKNITLSTIEQRRLSACLSYAIKFKKYKEARNFASKLKINSLRNFLKRFLIFIPVIFRLIQKKNMQ